MRKLRKKSTCVEHLWHLLGSKSQLIIGQKSRKNAQYYRCVLRKKILSRVGGGGLKPLWYLLGTKISLDYRPTKSK